jgi:hypothetical protein
MLIFIQLSVHHFRTKSIAGCSNLQSSAGFMVRKNFRLSANSEWLVKGMLANESSMKIFLSKAVPNWSLVALRESRKI